MNFLRKNWPALSIATLAVAFLAIGVVRGEDQTVFRKAINICMECIGLG